MDQMLNRVYTMDIDKLSKREVIDESFESEYSLSNLPQGKHHRHIFIFLDGTWNEERSPRGSATPTNVLRLYQEISQQYASKPFDSAQSDSHEVLTFYYRGVGSRQDNSMSNRFWFGFNGKDEERIRSAAFADVYRCFQHSKYHIYIFGFSRGAASARLLARDICHKGLPPRLKVYNSHFPNLLTGQIEARVNQIERLEEGKALMNINPRIAFLGCWDTVDAFVLPSRFPRHKKWDKTVRVLKYPLPRLLGKERFRDEEYGIPKEVQKAVHCVAIDETRNAFLPTLMPNTENVEEVWFPGVHADVGGGYDDNGLAVGPYQFMKARLIQSFEWTELNKNPLEKNQRPTPEYCFHFHGLNTGLKSAKGIVGFGSAIRMIHVLGAEQVKPKIHESFLKVKSSDLLFAANAKNRRTWRITYDPYNVRQLEGQFDIASDNCAS